MDIVILTALGIGGATVVGALIGFLFKNVSRRMSDAILGFAARRHAGRRHSGTDSALHGNRRKERHLDDRGGHPLRRLLFECRRPSDSPPASFDRRGHRIP